MITDWQTNAVFFSSLFQRRFPTLWNRIESILIEHSIFVGLLEGTKDIWVRDFMPIQVNEKQFVKFTYAPDYLRNFDHLRTGPEVCDQLPFVRDIEATDICLDGGNLVAANNLVIVTEKVLEENPHWSESQLQFRLQEMLRVERCIFVPREYCDWIGHADGILRFLNENTVICNDYKSVNLSYAKKLVRFLEKDGIQVRFLPHFVTKEKSKCGIPSAVGNYANFLRIGNLVLLPAFDCQLDSVARDILDECLPSTKVTSIRCNELAREGGILNCIAWSLRRQPS